MSSLPHRRRCGSTADCSLLGMLIIYRVSRIPSLTAVGYYNELQMREDHITAKRETCDPCETKPNMNRAGMVPMVHKPVAHETNRKSTEF